MSGGSSLPPKDLIGCPETPQCLEVGVELAKLITSPDAGASML